MDVAFVSQFVDGRRVFRYVDAEPVTDDSGAHAPPILEVGEADDLEDSYCLYVVNGMLPGFLPDAADHRLSASLAATSELGIGTHLSVPIHLPGDRLYGTLCCFSRRVQPEVQDADLRALELLAGVIADYLEVLELGDEAPQEHLERLLRDPPS
jgi:GAF domain-containing protein